MTEITLHQQIWDNIIGENGVWNIDRLLANRQHIRSQYYARPEIFKASEWDTGMISYHKDTAGKLMIHIQGEMGENHILPAYLHRTNIVQQTFDKLLSSLREDKNDPIYQYIHSEYQRFQASPSTYGTEILFFDEIGDEKGEPRPRALLQLPSMPLWKLALTLSNGNIINNKQTSLDWYTTRLQEFSKQHITIAGASVASQATLYAIRLIKPDLLTIADPKGPNASNMNRSNYSLFNLLDTPNSHTETSKVISLARDIHHQDPFQLIHLYPEGVTEENMEDFLLGEKSIRTDKKSILIEAIDHFPLKYKLLTKAREFNIPTIQLVDFLSRSINGFISPDDLERKNDLFFGLPDKKIEEAFNTASPEIFAITATLATGAENAFADPIGRNILKGKSDGNPFNSIPQTGEIAAISGAIAARNAASFIIKRIDNPKARFPYRQQIVDIRTGRFILHRRSSLLNKLFNAIINRGLRLKKIKKV